MNKFIKIKNKLNAFIANHSGYEGKRKYLIKQGAIVGERTHLNCGVEAFGTEPYLIKCGCNCVFAARVNFITHDGGVNVLNALGYFDGKWMDNMAPIVVGDNVYIGMGAYIMPGVTIGNNVIIGANAVVTRNIPDNSVAVGMPARVIKNINEYYENGLTKNRFFATKDLGFKEKKKILSDAFMIK